jgi:hypothetical protein
MPRVHRVAALLDRWWLGIHHEAIRSWQLDYSLDEFTFRFNRRRSKVRGVLFYRLLKQAVQLDPAPFSRKSSAESPTDTIKTSPYESKVEALYLLQKKHMAGFFILPCVAR